MFLEAQSILNNVSLETTFLIPLCLLLMIYATTSKSSVFRSFIEIYSDGHTDVLVMLRRHVVAQEDLYPCTMIRVDFSQQLEKSSVQPESHHQLYLLSGRTPIWVAVSSSLCEVRDVDN